MRNQMQMKAVATTKILIVNMRKKVKAMINHEAMKRGMALTGP